MKVLFISSGNSIDGISIIVKNQAYSLQKNGIDVDFFPIIGKGLKGYFRSISKLKKLLKNYPFHVVHAHYSLSGIVALLARSKPMVVSLMGSDIQSNVYLKLLIKIFKLLRKTVIVKSESMKNKSKIDNAHVIPNGVDLKKFHPLKQELSKEKLGLQQSKRYIIFVSDPDRAEKNYQLAKNACELIKDINIQLEVVNQVDHNLVPFYMNAADVLILTSLWEGSPNVIKEAMACNCPIVSTNVGDVREVIGNTEGCYVTGFYPQDVADKLTRALDFGKRTNGRKAILHLDSNVIAKKLIKVYEHVLESN